MRNLLILLLLIVPLASAQTPLEAQDMTIKVTLSNILEVQPESQNYRVEEVTSRLSWVPRDSFRQEVVSLNTEPSAEEFGDELVFEWTYPKEKELWIRVNGVVRTSAEYYDIREKVDFPIKELDSGLSQYLVERDIIDFNSDIRDQAAELAEGRDDLYEVVVEIADWVNANIDYSLDTLTAEASQKSSWVLANRRGVCDEMTSLFISMLRTLGIPARFTYGESYTNVGGASWGGHGWAEVYFPGHGWIPFDPTYGEYGYLDAGHIKMGHSVDARRPSMRYTVKATNAHVTSGFLDIDADVIRKGEYAKDEFKITASQYYSEVGWNSYNLVTTEITNPDDIYKPVKLSLSVPKEVTVADQKEKHTILKPGETKKVYWIVKVDRLKDNFVYTFPMKVITDKDQEVEVSFKAEGSKQSYEKGFFESIIESEREALKKPNSQYLDLECSTDDNNVYMGDEVTLECTAMNTGKTTLRGTICLDSCQAISIPPGSSEEYTYTDSFENEGVKNLVVKASGDDFSRTAYTKVNVIDEADLKITVDAPATAEYDERVSVKFSIGKESSALPKNVVVRLHFQGSYQEWDIPSLERPNEFDVSIDTKGFTFTNDFRITASYEDEVGKKYQEEESLQIELANLSLKEKVIVALNSLGLKIMSLFS